MKWDRPSVVCVDDDPAVLASLKRQLRKEPYELLLTDEPARVLEWISERRIDVVIADQRMPRMSGVEILELVRDYSPETIRLILSGFPDTAALVLRSDVTVERLIQKPWDDQELKSSIRRALERRRGPETMIDCAGRSAADVVADVLALGGRPNVTLTNVRALRDSVSRLLKELARSLSWFKRPLDLRDDSGCVAAFFETLAKRPG